MLWTENADTILNLLIFKAAMLNIFILTMDRIAMCIWKVLLVVTNTQNDHPTLEIPSAPKHFSVF